MAEVDDDTPGFTRGRILDKMGQQDQDTAELSFDGLRVPQANLLGAAEGRGFYQLMEQLPQERLITAILAQAQIEKAVELTLAHTKERHAFGAPLLALQNTRFRARRVRDHRPCRAHLPRRLHRQAPVRRARRRRGVHGQVLDLRPGHRGR